MGTLKEMIRMAYARAGQRDVIIADESQFLTHFFPGSARLMELADSITEIKTICACGSKATVNARLDGEGNVVTSGGQVLPRRQRQLRGHVP